ncbi:MAG: ABC transporter substrate-binding protein [Desulfobacterales bacterium]|nr:MAG: ABC transporter substrate-binding protein [Desulfobacterales bacterium]
MERRRIGWIFLICMVVVLLGPHVHAGAPTETIQARINQVLEVLRDPALKDEAREVKVEKIRAIINEIFDRTELSRRTLGRDWKKLSAEQQNEFIDLFNRLLEKVYADRVLNYAGEKVVFEKESELGRDKVEVQTNIITSDNKEIPLYYRMISKNGQWAVYDVIIEGVSLVKNYRTQFGDILAKKPPEELLEILRKKVNEGDTSS